MTTLKEKRCAPCEDASIKALGKEESERLLAEIEGWEMDRTGKKIKKQLMFKNFDTAMDFVNLVADRAEQEGHHPDIYISYNKVSLELTTHSIKGLSENDFILAAKIDDIRL